MQKTEERLNAIALKMLFNDEVYHIREPQGQEFRYEGENNRYLLVLVPNELNSIEKEFLLKILLAVDFTIKDIAILDVTAYKDLSLKRLKDFFGCRTIIAFGIDPIFINIEKAISHYEPVMIENTHFLFTENLITIESDENHKRSLWSSMQKIFK
jgi:hypothetical protein